MMEKDITYINDLLRQYREGSISDKDRHVLEKIALDDPMVFDAMEGYALSGKAANEVDLERIKIKIEPSSSGRILTMRNLSVAAGLLILAGALLWVNGQFDRVNESALSQADVKEETQMSDKMEASEKIISSDSIADFIGVKPGDISRNKSLPKVSDDAPQTIVSPSTTPSYADFEKPDNAPEKVAVVVSNDGPIDSSKEENDLIGNRDISYELRAPATTSRPSATVSAQPANAEVPTSSASSESRTAENWEGLEKESMTDSAAASAEYSDEIIVGSTSERAKRSMPEMNAERVAEMATNITANTGFRNINGLVRDITGEPLIGASIITTDGTQGVSTDIDGTFEFPVDSSVTQLLISYTGYTDLQVQLDSSSTYDVVLDEGATLDEIVVTGYGSNYNVSNPEPKFVVPPDGRSAFKKTVAQQAESINCGTSGKVKLVFIVNKYGEPTDFSIKKSLSTACDQKAIDIIRKAGVWDNQTNRDKKVRYTITF